MLVPALEVIEWDGGLVREMGHGPRDALLAMSTVGLRVHYAALNSF